VSARAVARPLAAVAALIAVAPARAAACPVCFSGTADVLPAYFGTAVLLSLLPVVLAGAILLWLRRTAGGAKAANGAGAGGGSRRSG
jgi:hypothetical protein